MKQKRSNEKKEPSRAQLDKIAERAKAHTLGLGLNICSVDFTRADMGPTLSVVVQREDGSPVAISDCEQLSRPLSKELDELMADVTQNYMFEVTSKGVELPDETL